MHEYWQPEVIRGGTAKDSGFDRTDRARENRQRPGGDDPHHAAGECRRESTGRAKVKHGRQARRVRMNQDREREHLAQADRHLVELKGHIVLQKEIVQRLAFGGGTATHREEARRLLTNLQNSLRLLQHHRRLILEALQSSGGEAGVVLT